MTKRPRCGVVARFALAPHRCFLSRFSFPKSSLPWDGWNLFSSAYKKRRETAKSVFTSKAVEHMYIHARMHVHVHVWSTGCVVPAGNICNCCNSSSSLSLAQDKLPVSTACSHCEPCMPACTLHLVSTSSCCLVLMCVHMEISKRSAEERTQDGKGLDLQVSTTHTFIVYKTCHWMDGWMDPRLLQDEFTLCFGRAQPRGAT